MITVSVEHITPEIAKDYLKKNTNNYRKMKRSVILSYSEDIKNGRWETNGETISFAESGILKDGQHRLAAIIMANKAIDTVVVRGVSDDVSIIDRGTPRTNTDIAKALGVDCDSTIVAVSNIIVNKFAGKRGGAQVIDYTKAHVDELSRAMRIACYGTGKRSKNAPSVSAAYLMLRTKTMPSYEVELFFRLMNDFTFTQADGYEASPALIAQKMFDERGTKHSGYQIQKERLEILIMAMSDFHANRKREMKYKISEPFKFMSLLDKVRKEDGLN